MGQVWGAEVSAPVHSSVGGSSDVIPLYSQHPATPDSRRNISNLAACSPLAQELFQIQYLCHGRSPVLVDTVACSSAFATSFVFCG